MFTSRYFELSINRNKISSPKDSYAQWKLKMLCAYCDCCIYSYDSKKTFTKEANNMSSGPEVINFFMLNSTVHDISTAHKK